MYICGAQPVSFTQARVQERQSLRNVMKDSAVLLLDPQIPRTLEVMKGNNDELIMKLLEKVIMTAVLGGRENIKDAHREDSRRKSPPTNQGRHSHACQHHHLELLNSRIMKKINF